MGGTSVRAVAICLAAVLFSCNATSLRGLPRHAGQHLSHDPDAQNVLGTVPRQTEHIHLSAQSDRAPTKDTHTPKEKYEELGWGTLYVLFISIVAFGIFKFVMLGISYRTHIRGFHKKGFYEYCWYSLESWFVRSSAASCKLITAVFLLTLLTGSLLVGSIMHHSNPFTSLWTICGWVMDPGSAFGLQDQHELAYCLSAAFGILGILMLALLLTLMQDGFTNSMNKLRKGESAVMESDHVTIIGYTQHTIPLLHELCHAHKEIGGTPIVVLSADHKKSEMDTGIKAAEVQTMGSTIVTRCGKSHCPSDLRHVAAHTSKTIIILPKLEEDMDGRDAYMLRTLATLRGQGWPFNGRIVAVCSLVRNYKLFEEVGGEVTDIVMLENFIGKIMTSCSGQPGLSSTLSQIFSAGYSDFLISPVPKHLHGMKFAEAREYYPNAVPVGIMEGQAKHADDGNSPHSAIAPVATAHSCRLCPGPDFVLEDGQDMVFIATGMAATHASFTPILPAVKSVVGQKKSASVDGRSAQQETILIWGWNEFVGNMILELDGQVPPETELMVISENVSKEERGQDLERMLFRWKKQIKNLKISQHLGRLGSRFDMENLSIPVEKASRIFFLSDTKQVKVDKWVHEAPNEQADASTITAILQIRDMLLEKGVSKDIAIIPEIKDSLSRTMCEQLSIVDFVETTGLPSKVLAMVAHQPRIQVVLNEIISHDGKANFSVRCLDMYFAEELRPAHVSFCQVSDIVASSGHIAIGWSRPFSQTSKARYEQDESKGVDFHRNMSRICREAHGKHSMTEYELNPDDKTEEREWSWEDDKVVVLICS